jgi:hypothetical protein
MKGSVTVGASVGSIIAPLNCSMELSHMKFWTAEQWIVTAELFVKASSITVMQH